jgi:hypothetical protein
MDIMKTIFLKSTNLTKSNENVGILNQETKAA